MTAMKAILRPGESLVKEGRANLFRNVEAVGGMLYLTTQRLLFEFHRINVQSGPEACELDTVRNARPAWTKLLGLLPILPNGLAVSLHDGREAWAAAISEAVQTSRASRGRASGA
jgi:hypothetical protein